MHVHRVTDFEFNVAGEKQTASNKLRSILAQLVYKHEVRTWNSKGVPFQSFMYIPEVYPLSHKEFHEREDKGHVFKVYK